MILIKQGFFPLIVTRDDRVKYIEALELADQGDLAPLIRLFAQLQKRALTRAIGTAVEAKPVKTLDEAIRVTRELLLDLGRTVPAEYQTAKDTAGALFRLTAERLNEMNGKLANEIGRVNAAYKFKIGEFGGPPNADLDQLAKTLHYDPNPGEYHETIMATLEAPSATNGIVVSFHGVGTGFRGLVAAVTYFRDSNGHVTPLSDDIFRISYEEPRPEIEAGIVPGLTIAWLRPWRYGGGDSCELTAGQAATVGC